MSASRVRKNKFCKLRNLRNESDVEQNFIVRLLDDLGFTDDYRETKTTLHTVKVDKGKRQRKYIPDYVCFLDKAHKRPVLVVDAKSPTDAAMSGATDAQLYASVIRRSLSDPKPDQFCIGSNGLQTVVLHYDSGIERHSLDFVDFVDGNPRYGAFKAELRRTSNVHRTASGVNDFTFTKPDVKTLRSLFEACHDVIWKREFESPVPAFWEFCKLMFIKLHEDRRLRTDPKMKPLLQASLPLPRADVLFSVSYIDRVTSDSNPNPIATIFETIRDILEAQVLSGEKKRIFERDERVKLGPLTIRRVVELLEHHDLIQIDEDLNGRLFQTFLSATMRGKQLGQFFTPRTVVDFMCDLADLRLSKKPPYAPLILDACCGTGGFLIEAMAKLTRQLKDGPLSILTAQQKRKIEKFVKDDRLIGIDAGKDPPVARIARINMYLHGDGGSQVFSADALDKKVRVSSTASPEMRRELKQLRTLFTGADAIHVDVALTNPPFSMKKEAKETDQRDILKDYEAAFRLKSGVKTFRASLKSNVMFLERYRDLVRAGGKLITVIDESVLNTSTAVDHRVKLFQWFYIRAIISLPQDAFVEAGANVKTSILFLERKDVPSDDQPTTFYGRSDNIGYKGRSLNESLSDLPEVLAAFHEFEHTGKVPRKPKAHWTERTRFYAKKLADSAGRIDFEWNDPRHVEMGRRLRKIAKQKGYIVAPIGGEADGLCDFVVGKGAKEYVSAGVPILKVRNITSEGIDWNTNFVLPQFYANNAKSHLLRGDVLTTTTGLGTIGRVDLFNHDSPCMTDGHVTTLRLRTPKQMDPDFLVHYLRSPLGQMQMDRYTVGYTGQTELNDRDLARVKVIFPATPAEQDSVVSEAKRYETAANQAREEQKKNRLLSRTEFERLLGL